MITEQEKIINKFEDMSLKYHKLSLKTPVIFLFLFLLDGFSKKLSYKYFNAFLFCYEKTKSKQRH